tara:strand:+ start:388 stop:579 length:192 start_codon:yes stop_codon:yes gene_type:complete
MKTFAFLTEDSWRIEVLASNANAGYKKLKSIPYFNDRYGKITKSYYEYPPLGFCSNDNIKRIK